MAAPKDRPDRDRLERAQPPRPPQVGAAAGASIPAEEPVGQSLVRQRELLLEQLAQLEGSLRYMGTAHPQQQALTAKREQLRAMLAQLDQELGRQRL